MAMSLDSMEGPEEAAAFPAPPAAPSMVVPASGSRSVSDALIEVLAQLGVRDAFGIFGGAIAHFCEALSRSVVTITHFRHEAGAAFAAVEASLATDRPVVVFVTAGPGMTNVITGMAAARWEGAKVIFVSATTPAAQRGRFAFQETSHYMLPIQGLYAAGPLVHYGTIVEAPEELAVIASRLASGLAQPTGFVAHIGLPISMQAAPAQELGPSRVHSLGPPRCDPAAVAQCANLLGSGTFGIWVGHGARRAAAEVRALATHTGAPVMASPRGKGIFPESHPQYLGVTGLGGHTRVTEFMRERCPDRILVLGSRLGEFTSFWEPELVPPQGFVHVDLEPDAFGSAFPGAPTLGVQADIRGFVTELLEQWPAGGHRLSQPCPVPRPEPEADRAVGPVRSSRLLREIQRVVVSNSDAPVITEAGNSFALGSHWLAFDEPGRYRVSSGFGSMGHAVAGVVGMALARRGKAVAIVGDGAMMMLNELNTAARYGADAVWIVLNDARYGMIEQGMQSLGWTPFEVEFPRVDFVQFARSMGAQAVRVERETELAAALEQAMTVRGPFVVDVHVDPRERAPSGKRNKSLAGSGQRGRLRAIR